MRKLFFVFLSVPQVLFSQQAPNLKWQRSLGGTGYEVANCIIQTSDGGYAVAAYETSDDGDISGNHGSGDAWIIKLDAFGAVIWKKCFGGSGDDYANWIIQTSDGGYIFAGKTSSADGDVTGFHGGEYDAWVVKLNASGILEWQKCYGGSDYDQANHITTTRDGGYIFCGVSYSHDGDVKGNHDGPGDAWFVKIDSLGNIQWQKCVGGTGNDEAICVIQTRNGEYAAAGRTTSHDGDITKFHGGDYDAQVIILDSSGNLKRQTCYGGDSTEHFHSIVQTSDGGFICSGHTTSNDQDVSGFHGGFEDGWVVKTDSSGKIEWQKCLGGSGDDGIYSIQQTSDGYVGAGWSNSTDGDVSGGHGDDDLWVVKLNFSGTLEWQKCLGGSQSENANSIALTSSGGYVVAGFTNSSDGDVLGYHGGQDAWIVLLMSSSSVDALENSGRFEVFPNPSSGKTTIVISAEERGHAKISVVNLLGEEVAAVFEGEIERGEHSFICHTPDLPSGMYSCIVRINSVIQSFPMILRQ